MKNLVISLMLFFTVFSAFMIMTPATVNAASKDDCSRESASLLGFPTWYKYLWTEESWDGAKGECNINVQIPEDAGKILAAVFEIMLRVVSIVSIIFVIYGGIQYIISQGEPENIKNARTTIFNALIGLVVAMLATTIVSLVAGSIY